MKKMNLLLILVLGLAACGPSTPSGQTTISGCQAALDGLSALINKYELPQHFMTDNPAKQGGEFDVMDYFTVFDHLSMKSGYLLDYVYHFDGMGGYPVLYARSATQPPYATEADLQAVGDQPGYLDYVQAEDTPEGYFQFALLATVGGKFYLNWHANYNDTQIVCDKKGLNGIVSHIGKDDFGLPLPLTSRLRTILLNDVEPVVSLGEGTVEVRLITFTNWGGFYLTTYSIDRSSPHTILDVQEKNLIPYDCGIMF